MNFSKGRYKNIIQIILKVVGVQRSYVMRESLKGRNAPARTYGQRTTLSGFAAAVAVPAVLMLALAAPVATAAVAALTVGGYVAVRTAADYRAARRSKDQSREVCVGDTDVCVEV